MRKSTMYIDLPEVDKEICITTVVYAFDNHWIRRCIVDNSCQLYFNLALR